ncbi:MAG TPA: SGNH/GDSL hydrolase family protein, partial [Trebonia sp.]|nr:SGNH/GDSL hydrolase family protein [Trebonia sp.]
RRYGRITAAAAVLLAGCLAFTLVMVVRMRDAAASRAVSSVAIQPREATAGAAEPGAQRSHVGTAISVATPLAACETRIEREPYRLPVVAVVGASYTAGTGPGKPDLSWAVDLARLLHWNAVVDGVPGAGYVRPGNGGHGPMSRMLSQERLRELAPALVNVQAGHDDVGVPAAVEEQRAAAVVELIHAAAPGTRIALLTAFAVSSGGSPALRRTDHAIVAGGTAADPGTVIMDPLAGRWTFPRARDGLHPTTAGDAWIARRVAAILQAHGIRPAAAAPAQANRAAPVICDVSVGVGKPAGSTT